MAGTWFNRAARFATTLAGPGLVSFAQIASPTAGTTLRRTRLEPQFSVVGVPQAGATGIQIDWWQNVILTWGVYLTSGATTAPNPPDPHTNPPTTRAIIWGAGHFVPEVYDTGAVYLQLSARPNPQVLESFSQELAPTGQVSALWLSWHIDDPANVIGHTVATVQYQYGYTYHVKTLWTPTP